MSRLSQLKEQIEHERKILDRMATEADDMTRCCAQSRKLDELVDEYYRIMKQECGVVKRGELSPTYPPLYILKDCNTGTAV